MPQTFIGVDGCRAGWLAVSCDGQQELDFAVFHDINALWEVHQDAQIILIDMPIGLSEVGQRRCDIEARRVLGDRRSTIFPVPTRAALYADTYEQASTVNRHITGMKLSKQTWNIVPKIRELDELLRSVRDSRNKIAEIHPEVLFWGLTGAPMQHNKKTEDGYHERLDVLTDLNPNASKLIQAALDATKRVDVARDDIVDALVAAIVASIGDFGSLPPRPDRDGHGLPMQILFAHGAHQGRDPRILGFHHTRITIPRGMEIEARAFYCGILGLTESERVDKFAQDGGFWLDIGEDRLHILPVDPDDRRPSYIAYAVDNLAQWRDRLKAAGLTLSDEKTTMIYRSFSLFDPFGNRLELVQGL